MLGINQLCGFGAGVVPANLVTNGDFTGGNTGWTVGTGWSTASGAAVHSGGYGTLTQASVFTSGVAYRISFRATVTGTFNLWINGAELVQSGITTSEFSRVWLSRTTGSLFFEAIATAAVTLDSVIVSVANGRGPELITNGAFDADSNWTKGSGWSIASGVATHGGASTGGLVQASIFTSGKTYEIKFDLTKTGTVNLWIAGTELVQAGLSSGAFSLVWRASTTGSLYVEAISSAVVTLDNVSVKEVI